MTEQSRAERERERYNEGLVRGPYESVLAHAQHYYRRRRNEIVRRVMQRAVEGRTLELGSITWVDWLERQQLVAGELHCINISETELSKGLRLAEGRRNAPRFHLMDAHALGFADGSFDVVFGNAILHHLDFHRALDEIERVLAPGGGLLFLEPLDLNPVGWAVRALTPRARTEDERPFRFAELRELKRRFDCTLHYEQLFSVPAGVLSRAFRFKPANPLTWTAYKLDRLIELALPPLRPLFRSVLIEGRARGQRDGS
jgi:SAM-dependent methyltransferase